MNRSHAGRTNDVVPPFLGGAARFLVHIVGGKISTRLKRTWFRMESYSQYYLPFLLFKGLATKADLSPDMAHRFRWHSLRNHCSNSAGRDKQKYSESCAILCYASYLAPALSGLLFARHGRWPETGNLAEPRLTVAIDPRCRNRPYTNGADVVKSGNVVDTM